MMMNSNFEFKMEKTSPNGQVPFVPRDQDMGCIPEMAGEDGAVKQKQFEPYS